MLDSNHLARIVAKVRDLRASATERDQADADIFAVRNGNIDEVFPGMFNEDFPKPIIANFVDIAARDVAESLAPLPAFNASATNMVSDAARARADKKVKGMHWYIEHSQLQRQMYTGADYYASYGRMPILIEPDFQAKCPRWLILDPRHTYPEYDRWGNCVSFTKIFKKKINELCAEYPEYAHLIPGPGENPSSQTPVELALYRDDKCICLILPERNNLVLAYAPEPMGVCTVVVARRPGLVEGRGQFDDILWTQVARNRFANMAMAAAEQAAEAPLAVPYDVQEIALGALSLIRSSTPEKIRRVGTEIPQAAFAESQLLEQEMRIGARYPGTRTGNVDASIITGQGVRALEGGFDSQIRAAQDVFRDAFQRAMSISLKMDEFYWPDDERSIRGNQDGVPYEIRWKPSRDIRGDYSCDVSYGFAVGLDANRSLVFILQMLGARLISKDLARRQFPFSVNVTQEEQRIAVEDLRDSLIQSIAGYAQSVPVLAQSGMDPTEAVTRISQIIKGIQKGKALEDVVETAFAPPEPAPGSPGAEMMPGEEPAGPGGPGLAGGPPPPPDLMQMLAGLNAGGSPALSARVLRQMAA